jgi:hypothetical protein
MYCKSKFPKQLKGTCLCITSSLRKPACDAQAAQGNPEKLIPSSFSEHSANYAVLMYIKILTKYYSNHKFFKAISSHAEYRFDIVENKKA